MGPYHGFIFKVIAAPLLDSSGCRCLYGMHDPVSQSMDLPDTKNYSRHLFVINQFLCRLFKVQKCFSVPFPVQALKQAFAMEQLSSVR